MNTLENYTGIAKRLFDEGFLTSAQLNNAITKAKSQKVKLLDYVITAELINCDAFALATAKNFGYPFLDLNAFAKEYLPFDALTAEVIIKHQVLPLHKTEHTIAVAIADPTNKVALDEIQFYTGKQILPIIVNSKLLEKLIAELIQLQEETGFSRYDNIELDKLDISNDEIFENTAIAVETNDAPIIRFVHTTILDAINKGASDIHFEPYEKYFRIRFRLDGVLYETTSPPIALANRICARIKVMSRLDISERRIPQDGRFKLNLSASRTMDFRVSTCPTIVGEKVVIRILDPTATNIGIDALGLEFKQRELFLKYINQPQGMILVTGPTGSGKTVTMYAAINILNTSENNISAIEDPIEIHVTGINQVNINLKAGLTFATAMRAFLRQDPDIIMVGEMRDLETAEIGIKAAQTGHLVLSTLHTNNAPETLTRLASMGIPSYNIATSVSMIIAQRLIRKLCSHCKIIDDLAQNAIMQEQLTTIPDNNRVFYRNNPKGCEFCHQGFKGRVGIFEILSITHRLSSAILSGVNSLQLLDLAKSEGMLCLRDAGLLKVQAGITSLDEINRVT